MTTATSVKLDDDLKSRVQRLAESRQRKPHWIMREAIAQYVKREEARDALRQDTLNAMDEFRAAGLQITADEVDQWLASWGTDNELPAPVCHK